MCHNSLQFLYSKNVFDESAARGALFPCHPVTLSPPSEKIPKNACQIA